MGPKNNNNLNLGGLDPLGLPLEVGPSPERTEYIDLDEVEGLQLPKVNGSAAPSETNIGGVAGGEQKQPPKNKRKRSVRQNLSEEELRQRRIERQKGYRQRQRDGEIKLQDQIATTAAAIEAAQEEHNILLTEQAILPKVAEYCKESFHAAQSFVGKVKKEIQHQYDQALEGIAWIGLQYYTPTDAQLHAYLDAKSIDDIHAGGENIWQRTYKLLIRWEKEPEHREKIEKDLERLQEIRVRCMAYLHKTRLNDAVELSRRRMMPTGPDGQPNPELVAAAAEMELTPEQLESFEREWTLYLQRTEAIRQETRSMISLLTNSGTTESLESLCMNLSAGLFLQKIEAVQGLETHPHGEAMAWMRLSTWGTTELTASQKLCLLSHCVPFMPDFIQLGIILFGNREGENATWGGRDVQSVYTE